MDAMIGRSARSFLAIISSRQMASDAAADPPGLSMRRTIARSDAIPPRLADRLDERFRTDDRAVQRIVAALTADDRAGGVNHRDARTAVQAQRRRR